MKNSNYKNKEWLFQKYWIEELSALRLAEECGVDDQTIYEWMKRHKIERRSFAEAAILLNKRLGRLTSKRFIWSEREFIPHHLWPLICCYREARRAWEEWHMLKLPKGWIVHHRDYNSCNNEIWNLWALPRSIHNKIHKRFVLKKTKQRGTQAFEIQESILHSTA